MLLSFFNFSSSLICLLLYLFLYFSWYYSYLLLYSLYHFCKLYCLFYFCFPPNICFHPQFSIIIHYKWKYFNCWICLMPCCLLQTLLLLTTLANSFAYDQQKTLNIVLVLVLELKTVDSIYFHFLFSFLFLFYFIFWTWN